MATSENRLQWTKKRHWGLWVALGLMAFGFLVAVALGIGNKFSPPKEESQKAAPIADVEQKIVDTTALDDQLQQLDFETKAFNGALNAIDAINKQTDQDNPLKKFDKITTQADMTSLYQSLVVVAQESKKTISQNLDLHPDEKQMYYDEQDRAIDFYTAEVAALQKSPSNNVLNASRDRAKAFNDDHAGKIKRIASALWDQRITTLAAKYQAAASPITQTITLLEGLAFDSADLRAHLDQFQKNVSDAQSNSKKAAAKVSIVTTMDDLGAAMTEGRALVDQSLRNLEEAHGIAQQIVVIFENTHLKALRVSGTDQVFAKGRGVVTFAGNGGVTIYNIAGSVVVTDNTTRDATGVTITDIKGTGTPQRTGNAVYYPEFTGSMKIAGTDVKIQLSGDVDLQAGGMGSVELKGDGTWSSGQKKSDSAQLLWSEQGFNIELQ